MRCAFVSVLGLLPGLFAAAQGTLAISVTMTEVNDKGTLRLALCTGDAAFESEQGCLLQQVPVDGSVVTVMFTEVREGNHAIKAFHDVNDNGKLDTNWLGIPTEPYGFSNDAMGTFGPPSFEDARFEVKGGNTVVRMRLKG